jgi:hypothetical protein
MLGELAQAKRELQEAMALYNPEQHAPLALIFSHDFKATAQVYLGVVMALCGDIDEGVGHSHDALGYAQDLRHPHSTCDVLSFLAGTYLCAGNPQAAFPVADRTVAQSNELGFPQWVAGGLMLRGWAHLGLGELEAGLADIRSSIRALRKLNADSMQFSHYLLACLAADHQWSKAAEIVDRLSAEITAGGGRWYNPK